LEQSAVKRFPLVEAETEGGKVLSPERSGLVGRMEPQAYDAALSSGETVSLSPNGLGRDGRDRG